MEFLHRVALTIVRKQPYIDWANTSDDDPEAPALTPELAQADPSVYLVPEMQLETRLDEALGEWWEDIFEAELSLWEEDEARWPPQRTRQMFDEWFSASICNSVVDLAPHEPLTTDEADERKLFDAMHGCAWCGLDLDDEEGRFTGVKLRDRAALAFREGRAVHIPVGPDQVVSGVMSLEDSDAAREGTDIGFRVCTARCEKALHKAVRRALKDL
jgi:hypothetical protein